MIVIQGKGVSKGVASGPIYFFQRASATITDAPAADIEEYVLGMRLPSSLRPMPCLWMTTTMWSA